MLPEYDWKKTAYKALKTGAVAAAAYIVADPTLMPAVLAAVPANYRMVAMVALPAIWSALRNWIKNTPVSV